MEPGVLNGWAPRPPLLPPNRSATDEVAFRLLGKGEEQAFERDPFVGVAYFQIPQGLFRQAIRLQPDIERSARGEVGELIGEVEVDDCGRLATRDSRNVSQQPYEQADDSVQRLVFGQAVRPTEELGAARRLRYDLRHLDRLASLLDELFRLGTEGSDQAATGYRGGKSRLVRFEAMLADQEIGHFFRKERKKSDLLAPGQ